MRAARDICEAVERVSQAIKVNDARGEVLRYRLGKLLGEARDHPELTLEAARQIPEKPIPRTTANELIRGAAE